MTCAASSWPNGGWGNMSERPISEMLFAQFCQANEIPCSPVGTGPKRTPDFVIQLATTQVTCEVKQIDPNPKDRQELAALAKGKKSGRSLPNRMRTKLKDVSAQLQAASRSGRPTLLVVYDNVPFGIYTDHADVVQAMFGELSVEVAFPDDPLVEPQASSPFFGGNQGTGPAHNTAVSAIAILERAPEQALSLRVYHNRYAAVRLSPDLLASFPVTQTVLPDMAEVSL